MATSWVDQITGNGETVAYKAPCRVATTADIILSGLLTVDGVTLAADDRVLVTSQAVASQNGIYIAASGPWQRARDFDSNRDVTKGTRVTVTDGATNAGREYVLTSANPIHVGTSAIVITETLSSDAGGSAAAAAASAAAALISEQHADADAVATAADRVQTGLDAAATAADRVQTGLDRAAAAADRAQADLDAVATAADRVQTGADRIATAADRVQTGIDAAAASASADEAEDWAEQAASIVIGDIAAAIHAASAKASPVNADELAISDSAASWGLKKLTWANLKAALSIPPFVPLTTSTNADDWNTLESLGWFGQLVNGTGTNSPGGSEYYFLHNADYGSGYTLQQTAFPRRTVSGRIGLRSRHNAVWESWRYLPWADTVLHLAGGTMTGKLALPAAVAGHASLRIPQGVTPDVGNLVNGDLWLPASGGFSGRRGGVTVELWDTSSLVRPAGSEINAGVAATERAWAAADVFTFMQRHRRVSRKTSDQSFATQTLSDVSGLSVAVGANEVWAYEAEVLFEKTTETNAYPNIAINGPSGGYVRGGVHMHLHQAVASYAVFGEAATFTGYDQTPITVPISGVATGVVRLFGYIAVGSTAGAVFIRGARNGTTGTATIKDGSILKAYRIT